MVDSWDNNKLYVNSSGNLLREEDQKWQMSLWNHIFNRNTPYLHISKVLTKVLDLIEIRHTSI
ncbi:MAG: hypothetical protein B6229_10715 [Spirochaetaceae bacterium 4572_7]|nr:MAG: hypothetical protein B6229_10715 [Spirochaetaceae bacterium 4572_7]